MWKLLNQNASFAKPSKLHEVTNDNFLSEASKIKLNPCNKNFIKQNHHKLKANNVKILKVQKVSFKNLSDYLKP
jgi:hypothetical protein